MNADETLRGACSCGRYNYLVHIPEEPGARNEALVHFGTGDFDRKSHASILSAWLRVPLTWYHSATVSYFPDERHDHIARTFSPLHQPGCQRKFCGLCGTHISYWTEEPENEQEYINITLGSLRRRDILALEDLDLLPEEVDLVQSGTTVPEGTSEISGDTDTSEQAVLPKLDEGTVKSSRSGTSGGISWFEDMIQGSQLGHHSKRRKGHGTSADGSTTVAWEISEYTEGGDEVAVPLSGSKRKADDIEPDDAQMKD